MTMTKKVYFFKAYMKVLRNESLNLSLSEKVCDSDKK